MKHSITDLFKVIKGIANPILCDHFPLLSLDYNLMSQIDFSVSSINTWCYGLNCLRYLASKAWNIVPLELKNLTNFEMLKWEIVHNMKIIK